MKWMATALALSLIAAPATAAPKGKAQKAQKPAAARAAAPAKSFSFSYKSSRGRLGVQAVDLTDELRAHFGAPRTSGILVSRVAPESPAAKAGVRVGDVVTHIDRKPIDDTSDVGPALAAKRAGEAVEIGLIRNRAALRLSARLDTEASADDVDADIELSFDGVERLFEGNAAGKGWHKEWHWRWPSKDGAKGAPDRTDKQRYEQRLKELEKRQQELEKKMKGRGSQRT